jgi:hypothetical protein
VKCLRDVTVLSNLSVSAASNGVLTHRIFRRQHFIRGLQCGLQPDKQPAQFVHLIQQLVQQQLFGLSLLQVNTTTSAEISCSSPLWKSMHHVVIDLRGAPVAVRVLWVSCHIYAAFAGTRCCTCACKVAKPQ